MDMTLEELSYIAEIIGLIFIIVSLFYVALQIKQNTHATQLNTVHSICAGFREQYRGISSNSDTAKVFLKGLSKPESLKDEEEMQFFGLMHDLFRIYEDAHFQYKNGALPELIYNGINQQFISLNHTKGLVYYWEKRKHFYNDVFKTYVEEIIKSSNDDSRFKLAGSDEI